MAACDTDNHVLLFKHSVVDVQQSVSGEEPYGTNEASGGEALQKGEAQTARHQMQDAINRGTLVSVSLSLASRRSSRVC